MPVEIVTVPTVREADGLAMSSRECLFSPADRERATCIDRSLLAARLHFAAASAIVKLLALRARC